MWTHTPSKVLEEAKTTLVNNGIVIALESDYSGRIENIPSYKPTKSKHILPIVSKLKKIGANPFIGHRLPRLMHDLGLINIEFGILSWEFQKDKTAHNLKADLIFTDQKLTEKLLIHFTYTPVFWVAAKKDDS